MWTTKRTSNQTNLVNVHSTNRWSTFSTLFLHIIHKFGPIKPLVIILSYVNILYSKHYQMKHLILSGKFHFHNFLNHHFPIETTTIEEIATYADFAFICPSNLFLSQFKVSNPYESLMLRWFNCEKNMVHSSARTC